VRLFGRKTREREASSAVEELAELTEANRREPDADRERRIVRLRHDAFAELEHGEPGPIPEPDFDAIEIVDGMPSVPLEQFTPEALRAGILEGGCLLLRGAIGRDRCEELIEGIESAFASREGAGDHGPGSEPEWYTPLVVGDGTYNLARQRQWVTTAGGLWTADSPRMTYELIDVFADSGMLETIEGYLGQRPAVSVNKWTLRKVEPGGDADWHQDGAFLGEEIRAMNIWMALTDCGRDAPGMDIVTRRLDGVIETGTDGARFDWSVSPQKVEELLGSEAPLRPAFRAGDVLLFDELFLHQTANRPEMSKDRYAVETWCFAPGAYPAKQVPLVL
jgi:hypothetical protein